MRKPRLNSHFAKKSKKCHSDFFIHFKTPFEEFLEVKTFPQSKLKLQNVLSVFFIQQFKLSLKINDQKKRYVTQGEGCKSAKKESLII
jgi:hypothetical protein